MDEPMALAAGLGRRNPRLAPSAHYPEQTFRGANIKPVLD